MESVVAFSYFSSKGWRTYIQKKILAPKIGRRKFDYYSIKIDYFLLKCRKDAEESLLLLFLCNHINRNSREIIFVYAHPPLAFWDRETNKGGLGHAVASVNSTSSSIKHTMQSDSDLWLYLAQKTTLPERGFKPNYCILSLVFLMFCQHVYFWAAASGSF